MVRILENYETEVFNQLNGDIPVLRQIANGKRQLFDETGHQVPVIFPFAGQW